MANQLVDVEIPELIKRLAEVMMDRNRVINETADVPEIHT